MKNRIFYHLLFLSFAWPQSSLADIDYSSPKCFLFEANQSTESHIDKKLDPINYETWCYYKPNNKEIFIFNYDNSVLREELSLLIDEKKNVSVGKYFQGESSIVKSPDIGVLPFNIIINLSELNSHSLRAQTFSSESLQNVNLLLAKHRYTKLTSFQKVSRNTESAFLAESLHPFRGFWWPHQDLQLSSGDFSPLGKYDQAKKIRTGQDPLSREWESKNHSLQNVPWGGHCNGWAASSILYKEPTDHLWDPMTKKVIFPSDIKGILAEGSFCVYWAFYGKRNNGNPGDDPSDIYPHEFHKLLRYYLGIQKKPIVIDYRPEVSVDNHVISGYQSDFEAIEQEPGWYLYKTTLQMHEYELHRDENSGKANMYTTNYYYKLKLDVNGNPIDGKWLSKNPDFVWVPLAQKDCGRENPRIDLNFVSSWLKSLPKAEIKTLQVNFSPGSFLEPNQEISITDFDLNIFGFDFLPIFESVSNHLINTLAIKYSAASVIYPNNVSTSPIYDQISYLDSHLLYHNLSNLKLVNLTNNKIEIPNNFKLKELRYWGGPELRNQKLHP